MPFIHHFWFHSDKKFHSHSRYCYSCFQYVSGCVLAYCDSSAIGALSSAVAAGQPVGGLAHLVQRRAYHGFQFASFHGWTLPYGNKSTKVSKEELEKLKFFTQRPNSKWDYNRIDENINSSSEFRRTENREGFYEGQREDGSTTHHGSLHTPSHYRLYEYFDEYTKPGVNKKLAAAYAVKEQWDSEKFYYPGEAWQKNRPGFRSVPKELLNRQTWYHWSDTIMKWDEIQPTIRTRSWNPDWPPPGYHMPKLQCKKEFYFGVEEEGLVSEIERYNWFRSWSDNNLRCGWREIPIFMIFFGMLYWVARNAQAVNSWRAMMSNMYYPGRQMIRPFGVPNDWEAGSFWWQKPLEEFPNQGEVWYLNKTRFGYINHLRERDAKEKAASALAVEAMRGGVSHAMERTSSKLRRISCCLLVLLGSGRGRRSIDHVDVRYDRKVCRKNERTTGPSAESLSRLSLNTEKEKGEVKAITLRQNSGTRAVSRRSTVSLCTHAHSTTTRIPAARYALLLLFFCLFVIVSSSLNILTLSFVLYQDLTKIHSKGPFTSFMPAEASATPYAAVQESSPTKRVEPSCKAVQSPSGPSSSLPPRDSANTTSHLESQQRTAPPKSFSRSRAIPRGKAADPCRLTPSDSDDSTCHHAVEVHVSLNPLLPPSSGYPQSSAAEKVATDSGGDASQRKILAPLEASQLKTPIIEQQPSFTAEYVKADNANDARHPLPFSPDADSTEIPLCCPDEYGATPEERTWAPGKTLRVSYVTWNMAGRDPNPLQVASTCILPHGHIVIVATQENGPYIGSNKDQKEWEQLVENKCLKGQYAMVGREHLWASHIMVFARKRDVALYFSHVHCSKIPCGFLGLGGNKGGVAVAFCLNLKPRETVSQSLASTDIGTSSVAFTSPARERPESSRSSKERQTFIDEFDDTPASETAGEGPPTNDRMRLSKLMDTRPESPSVAEVQTATEVTDALSSSISDAPFMTFLCINAHFPAHQEAIVERNNTYKKIIRQLRVGTKGRYSKFPWGASTPYDSTSRQARSSSSPEKGSGKRDVSDEFDVTLFGGDLNYRINGTQKAIEHIANRRSFRAVLSANDQLNAEKQRGTIFKGFSEGELRFRPTYKYAIPKETMFIPSSYQSPTKKKARMPAYCDRVLFRRRENSRAAAMALHTYTDVQEVTTSDHRPVVAIFDITTSPANEQGERDPDNRDVILYSFQLFTYPRYILFNHQFFSFICVALVITIMIGTAVVISHIYQELFFVCLFCFWSGSTSGGFFRWAWHALSAVMTRYDEESVQCGGGGGSAVVHISNISHGIEHKSRWFGVGLKAHTFQ
eukprot:gene4916-3528_t